jgi:hypothetical protein
MIRSTRYAAIAGSVTLSSMLIAACSSSTTSGSSTTPPTSSSSVATSAASGSTTGSLPSCPSVSAVNAALGQSNTGPVVTGTAQDEICTYSGGGGPLNTKVAISVSSPSIFSAEEQAVTSHGLTVVKVPGLGDQAYATQGGGFLNVLTGSTQFTITAPLTTLTQDEALARQII